MIIQSSNEPIVIDFGESLTAIKAMSIAMIDSNNKIIKRWSKDEIEFNGSLAICNQTQEETASYPIGTVKILIKFLNAQGKTEFIDKIYDVIVRWEDRKIMREGLNV